MHHILKEFFICRDIDIDVSGLGSLTWLRDRIRSWTIGHLRNKVLISLENEIRSAFDNAIDNTNCSDIFKTNTFR